MPLVKLCQHVWSLSTPDDEGCLDGGQMRNLMVMSGLDNAMLGTIWTMVDSEQRGKVRGAVGGAVGRAGTACAASSLPVSLRRVLSLVVFGSTPVVGSPLSAFLD